MLLLPYLEDEHCCLVKISGSIHNGIGVFALRLSKPLLSLEDLQSLCQILYLWFEYLRNTCGLSKACFSRHPTHLAKTFHCSTC